MTHPGDPRGWTPEHEARIRAALRAEAERVQTDPGALGAIRARVTKPPFWRSPVALGVLGATAVVAAMVVGTIVVVNGRDDDLVADQPSPTAAEPTDSDTDTATGAAPSAAPSDSSGGTPTAAPPPEETPDASATPPSTVVFAGALPVYYAVPSDSGVPKLVREWHHVETDDDPITAAVSQMFTEAPVDPDYVSLWAPTEVTSVEVTDEAIVIDLATVPSVDVPEGGQPAVEAAVQQLAYTATAAAARQSATDGSLPVRVLVDGERPDDLHDVGLAADVGRASQVEIRQLVQINDPTEGAEVTSPVAVTGEAAAFEAALLWEVRDTSSDEVVASGPAQAEVCCEFSEFGFSVELEPGEYTLSVSDTDPSGGAEGKAPDVDTKTFQVTESEDDDAGSGDQPELDDPTPREPSPGETPDDTETDGG